MGLSLFRSFFSLIRIVCLRFALFHIKVKELRVKSWDRPVICVEGENTQKKFLIFRTIITFTTFNQFSLWNEKF